MRARICREDARQDGRRRRAPPAASRASPGSNRGAAFAESARDSVGGTALEFGSASERIVARWWMEARDAPQTTGVARAAAGTDGVRLSGPRGAANRGVTQLYALDSCRATHYCRD